MKFETHIITISILMLFSIVSLHGQVGKHSTTVTAIDGTTIASEELDQKIDSIIRAVNMPGLSIAIINDAEMVYHNTFGVTNATTKAPVTSQTIFEGASLSKPIFAYFVMKMVDDGVLTLDQPLYEYLPHPGITEKSKEDYKRITARMVLAHRTGCPNHANGDPIELAFTPGTDFMY